jgi:hypothetical protein
VLDRNVVGERRGAVTCSCGKDAEPGKEECFRCRIATVGYSWRGGGFVYGRKNFSERTNAEYVAEHVGDTKRDGIAHVGSGGWTG